MIKKIVSGGQTGVDRASLDVARTIGVPHGGWCPKGRKAEDGVIPGVYQLYETSTDDYSERTKLNIKDSDGTLILVPSTPIKVTDGTILTINEVKERNKPFYIVDLSSNQNYLDDLAKWVKENNIEILNVAGPRESQSPGINQKAKIFLTKSIQFLLAQTNENNLNQSANLKSKF